MEIADLVNELENIRITILVIGGVIIGVLIAS